MRFGSFILRNLMRRRARSALTVLGVAVGVSAVVSLVSLSRGFVTIWQEASAERGTDLLVVQEAKAESTFFSTVPLGIERDLERLPGVARVTATLVDVIAVEKRPMVFVYGQELGSFVFAHLRMVAGERLEPGRDEILLGRMLARSLGRTAGDTVDVEGRRFRVAGVYQSGSLFEDGVAMMLLEPLQEILGRTGQATGFEVKVARGVAIARVRDEIRAALPGFVALDRRDAAQDDFALGIALALAWAVSAIALFVAAIGTTSTMVMSVLERTREIGILRAVGWRRWRVAELILGESMLLSLAGGVVGCLFGVAAVRVVTSLPQSRAILHGEFDVRLFLEAMAVAFAVGVAGGLYPAWWASRLSPVEAIGHE
jgi:putative ABC transport system permease protein